MERELTWQEKLEIFKVEQGALLTEDEKLCRATSLLEEIFTDRIAQLETRVNLLQSIIHK